MESKVGATSLTVIDDNEQIAGEYHLLPELFHGQPCYRKGDTGLFLLVDSEGQWKFSSVLGHYPCDNVASSLAAKPLLILSLPADKHVNDDASDSDSSQGGDGSQRQAALRRVS